MAVTFFLPLPFLISLQILIPSYFVAKTGPTELTTPGLGPKGPSIYTTVEAPIWPQTRKLTSAYFGPDSDSLTPGGPRCLHSTYLTHPYLPYVADGVFQFNSS